jgi:cytochrome P450
VPASEPPKPLTLPAGAQVWHVTRYQDVRTVLTDPQFTRTGIFGAGDTEIIETSNVMSEERSILNVNDADHQRLRRLVQRAFTPRHITTWRPWVASVIDDLVGALISAGPPVDLVPTFTMALPMRVICRLIGVPPTDQPRLQAWGDRAMSLSAFPAEEVRSAMTEFADYVTNLVATRRAQPGDDLLTSLITARDHGDDALTDDELVSLVRDLIIGGHETTMTALGNSLIALLDNDRQRWQQLTAQPELAATAVEELLRYVPLGEGITEAGLLRRATENVELGGITLPAGSIVAAGLMCANRDPATYPHPDDIDITRRPATPILTFGAGPHYCLGAWLARLELELSLRHLATRLPSLRLDLDVGHLTFTTGLMTRGPATLPVTWSN